MNMCHLTIKSIQKSTRGTQAKHIYHWTLGPVQRYIAVMRLCQPQRVRRQHFVVETPSFCGGCREVRVAFEPSCVYFMVQGWCSVESLHLVRSGYKWFFIGFTFW